ncbi:MAG: YdcH family protein [Hyphomonadaceae bacterium]
MSLTGRIEELSNRHRRLDTEIDTEQKRPAGDPLRLSELKRKKLRVKEELKFLNTG